MIEKARKYATTAHKGQRRKGGDLLFITHPLAVSNLLLKAGCSEKTATAGVLHDTIEDTVVTYENLIAEFDKEVADMVMDVTEKDKSDTWENRKQELLDEIPTLPIESLKIKVVDTYHNFHSIENDLKTKGEAVWDMFNAPKEKQEWYFTTLVEVMGKRVKAENDDSLNSLFDLFNNTVKKVFG